MENQFTTFGKIGITQPRRIAAISLAKRVSEEMNFKLGDQVGYHVRFEKKSKKTEKIKFMTDGILLNEMMSDYLLSDYSVIVIDEAHERKLATDILIGLLSRVIELRAKMALKEYKEAKIFEDIKIHPLRVVIMSATLRVSDFSENKRLFQYSPPIINIKVRTFPVQVYFSKVTPDDYIE